MNKDEHSISFSIGLNKNILLLWFIVATIFSLVEVIYSLTYWLLFFEIVLLLPFIFYNLKRTRTIVLNASRNSLLVKQSFLRFGDIEKIYQLPENSYFKINYREEDYDSESGFTYEIVLELFIYSSPHTIYTGYKTHTFKELKVLMNRLKLDMKPFESLGYKIEIVVPSN